MQGESNKSDLHFYSSLGKEGLFPILMGNAAFSFFSGCTFLFAQTWLAEIFPEAPGFLFPLLGAGLLLFALDIIRHVAAGNISLLRGWYFTLSDLAWVLGSVAILLLVDTLLPLGRILIWATAALVFLFSVLQGWHLLSSNTKPLSNI